VRLDTVKNTVIRACGFRAGYVFTAVSNLTVATTFDEASLTTLSTNAVPPVIVYQPVGVQSNFPTAVLRFLPWPMAKAWAL